MSRYRVKRDAIISYGTQNKAWIHIRVKQIWIVKTVPDKHHPWYGLARDCITIEIPKDDFKEIFEEVE